MSYTFHQENQAWSDDSAKPETPEGEVADPTGMTGTLDTSGTSGETQTAEDVSEVFDVADQAAADNPVPEATPAAPEVDPAATGEDALVPDYSQVNTDQDGHYAPTGDEGDAPLNTQTTDTTDTAGTDGSAVAHEGSEKVGADAAAEANAEANADADADAFNASKDPGDFNVKEVVAFFANASDGDVKKVIAAEKKGQARKGIVEYSK